MAVDDSGLPQGFVLDTPQETQDTSSQDTGLPPGFVMDKPKITHQNDAPFWQPLTEYLAGSGARAEQRIAERPSMIKSVIQDPPTLQRYAAHPVGTFLRSLGYYGELASGVPSDVMMDLGKLKPQDIPSDIKKTFQGKRPAQMGDYLTQSGFPEPAAAFGGVLLESLSPAGLAGEEVSATTKAGLSLLNPSAAYGNMVFSPMTHAVDGVLKMVGRPAASQVMRYFTGGSISAKNAERVLDNPKLLSKSWMAQEQKQVAKLYEEAVEPLRENPNAIVKLDKTMDTLKETKMNFMSYQVGGNTQTTGQVPSIMRKMTDSEQGKVLRWINTIRGLFGTSAKGSSFNDIEGLKYEIDRDLGKFYTKATKQAMTGVEARTTPFEYIASSIRHSLNEDMKTAFPEAKPAIELAHQHALNIDAANSFEGINVGFIKSIGLRLALIGGGIPTRGASLLALPATAPAFWKYAIPAGSAVTGAVRKNPALLSSLLRSGGIGEENQEE